MKILIVRYKYYFDRTWNKLGVQIGSALLDDCLRAFAAPRGHTVDVFFFDEMILTYGRDGARKKMWEYISTEKPDVCMAGFHEFDWGEELFQKMHDQPWTAFVYIGDDDTWRWERVSRHFAKYFDWIVTYDSRAVKKYHRIGCKNVIHHQPGANIHAFTKVDGLDKDIDVSFAGLWSKPRAHVIDVLRNAGINVVVRGVGWPEGPVSQEELLRIIGRSKIVLALNTASFYIGWRSITRLFFRRAYLGEGGSSIKLDIQNFPDNVRSWLNKRNLWVKARNFEVPACGAFEMTENADDLKDYYKLGEEIAVYKGDKDLVEKVRYYLAHPEECAAIAKRGYERTICDHSIERRYEDIFKMIGKPL